jgi:hypothetical protein
MATKKKSTGKSLAKDVLAKLGKVGITGVKTEDEAKAKMIEFLQKNEIDDCEDDSFEDLYDMVEAMYDGSEEEMNDIASEKSESAESEDEEEDEDDEEEDEDDDEEEDDDEDDEEEDDEEEDDEEEDDAEEVEKANDKKQKTAVKKATTKAKTTAKAKGEKSKSKRLNPLENAEDAKKYDGLKKVLGEDEFEFNFIANGGVSVKYLGKNSKKVFLSFDSPKVTKEGEILGRVYMSSIRDEDVLQRLFGDEIETKKSWSGNILIIGMPLDELVETLENNWDEFEAVLGTLTKKDEKLGKNRKKMEDDLKQTSKKKATEKKETSAKKESSKKTTAKVKKTASKKK